MFLRIIFIISLFFSFTGYSYSAASSNAGTKSNYDQAAKLIKAAKKCTIDYYLNYKKN